MLTFAEFLAEEFKIEKERLSNYYNGVYHRHHFQIGKHRLIVSYNEMYQSRGQQRLGAELGVFDYHPQTLPDHYDMSMMLDGDFARSRFRPKDIPTQLQIKNAVQHSLKEFVAEAKPKIIAMTGASDLQHKYWGKIGYYLAKHVGGEFHRGSPLKERVGHIISFRKK